MPKLPVVLLAPAVFLLACGGDESGSPDPIAPPPPRACSDAWQEWTFEPTGGDPTGAWEIVVSCGETVGKLDIWPVCDVIDQAFTHTEEDGRGSFVLEDGRFSLVVVDTVRTWKTWPLECITLPSSTDPIHDCEAMNGPVLGDEKGQMIGWSECAVPEGSDECHCYEEYDDFYTYAGTYEVKGTFLYLNGSTVGFGFATDGETLMWSHADGPDRSLMIARRRMTATPPAP